MGKKESRSRREITSSQRLLRERRERKIGVMQEREVERETTQEKAKKKKSRRGRRKTSSSFSLSSPSISLEKDATLSTINTINNKNEIDSVSFYFQQEQQKRKLKQQQQQQQSNDIDDDKLVTVCSGMGGGGKESIPPSSSTSNNNNSNNNNNKKGKEGGGGSKETEEQQEEDDDSEEEDDLLSVDGEEVSWVQWFTGFRGNEFFCQVDEDYIKDDFNLTGLSTLVPLYDYALDMIQDIELHLEKFSEEQQEVIENAAEVLYGLIHARYILTNRGMAAMYEKYQRNHFGRCPRVYCEGERVLPVGLSDVPRTNSLHIFCPKCRDVYSPTSSRHAALDGAYFGTSFCHLFLMAYPDLIPRQPLEINPNTLELSRMMQEQKQDENNMDVENKGDIPLLSSSRPVVK